MDAIPTAIVHECVNGMRDSISTMQHAFQSIRIVVDDNPELASVMEMVERQLVALTELADRMQHESGRKYRRLA
jgi:16S rRNA C1402 N4-methylase RsmH